MERPLPSGQNGVDEIGFSARLPRDRCTAEEADLRVGQDEENRLPGFRGRRTGFVVVHLFG